MPNAAARLFWLSGARDGRPVLAARHTRPVPRATYSSSPLHVRYDAPFSGVLVFQNPDRSNFQGRYVLRPNGMARDRPGGGPIPGPAAQRREQQARNLASLTGWSIDEIRRNMNAGQPVAQPPLNWWQRIWKDYSPF